MNRATKRAAVNPGYTAAERSLFAMSDRLKRTGSVYPQVKVYTVAVQGLRSLGGFGDGVERFSSKAKATAYAHEVKRDYPGASVQMGSSVERANPATLDRAKTRQNLFGFGRKPAPTPVKPRKGRGGLTLSEAGSAAFKAGKKSRDLSDFDSWMERKHLDNRSDGFVSRVRDDYKRGVARADADEDNREFLKQKREQARETVRDRKEQARDAKASGKRAAPGASAYPDEATLQAGFKRGLSLADMLRANPSLRKLKAANPARFKQMCAKLRKNPAAASAEVFEDFHGFEPTEVVTVSKQVHHHGHLASLGTLVQLDVWGVDGKGHKVTGFKGALLACNETRDQLFVEGGDQTMNLADFGIRKPHETETLGRVTNIGYQTNKTHLGDEGGEAVYVHRFRATNQNGKHGVVKMTREPDLIYDVRNEQLLFSGGSYEILREGINK